MPLVIGLLLFVGCSKSEPPVITLIKLIQSDKHDEVIEFAEKLIAENPDNSQAHRFLIESAVARSEGEKYREKYQKLAEANPTVAGYRLALGYVNIKLGNFDAALAELRKAVKLNPDRKKRFSSIRDRLARLRFTR